MVALIENSDHAFCVHLIFTVLGALSDYFLGTGADKKIVSAPSLAKKARLREAPAPQHSLAQCLHFHIKLLQKLLFAIPGSVH